MKKVFKKWDFDIILVYYEYCKIFFDLKLRRHHRSEI